MNLVTLSMLAGSLFAMAVPAQGSSSVLQALIPFALVAAVIYFTVLLPTKRQKQKVDEFLGALKVGDRVITTGGIYGQVVKINEASVQLQIADKVRIEVARAAIGGYQGQDPVVDNQN
jgi:preprotein translocase subunit YajC